MTQDRKRRMLRAIDRMAYAVFTYALTTAMVGAVVWQLYNGVLLGLVSDKPLTYLQAVAVTLLCDLLIGRAPANAPSATTTPVTTCGPPTN